MLITLFLMISVKLNFKSKLYILLAYSNLHTLFRFKNELNVTTLFFTEMLFEKNYHHSTYVVSNNTHTADIFVIFKKPNLNILI